MLSAKGIEKSIVDAALEEIDMAKASDRLMKLLENKYKSLKGDPQWKLKLLRFALGRGYSYDKVSLCIKKLKDDE
jgi:regulatory protein